MTAKVLSSDFITGLKIQTERQRAFDATRKDRERNFKNISNYIGVERGQWPDEDLKTLDSEDRDAEQYNIIEPQIDILAGSLGTEELDLDWKPIRGNRSTLTESIKSSWYSDSELCSYPNVFKQVKKDGLIYLGTMKMHVSERYDPLSNIALGRCMPGYIIFDPMWITDDDADCEKCWEDFYLDAKTIADTFGISSPMIDSAIRELKEYGGRYVENKRNFNLELELLSKGHLYRVTEFHWMENIRTSRLVGQVLGTRNWIPFPILNDRAKLERFMVVNKVDPNTLIESPYTDRIHHVTTICPELTERLLEDGIGSVQIKRLPYFQFTANRDLGKNKGIVDSLIDLQAKINKMETKMTDLVQTAGGGGKLVNKDLFPNPIAMERFKKEHTNPAYLDFVDGDELTKDRAIHYLNSNTYPAELFKHVERMYDVVNRLSKVSASMEAMSESANESGVLMNRKFQISRLASITILDRVNKLTKDICQGYFEQWQITYNDQMDREFSTRDGKYKTVINERIFDPETGRRYIKNRPEMVPRCIVICTASKNSLNQMLADQSLYSELFNLSTQFKPEYSSMLFNKLMKTMPLNDEDLAEIDAIATLDKIRSFKKLTSEIATMDAAEKQSMLMAAGAGEQLGQLLGQMGIPAKQPNDEALMAEEEIPQQPEDQITEEDNQENFAPFEREEEPVKSDIT